MTGPHCDRKSPRPHRPRRCPLLPSWPRCLRPEVQQRAVPRRGAHQPPPRRTMRGQRCISPARHCHARPRPTMPLHAAPLPRPRRPKQQPQPGASVWRGRAIPRRDALHAVRQPHRASNRAVWRTPAAQLTHSAAPAAALSSVKPPHCPVRQSHCQIVVSAWATEAQAAAVVACLPQQRGTCCPGPRIDSWVGVVQPVARRHQHLAVRLQRFAGASSD
mmetsp:Transcript_146345/g.380389  ORF Transcript_146345/g.380389 Transcript_146345/m.380389 type:complete len:218 (-) Transcript_146345:1250-1903(-)